MTEKENEMAKYIKDSILPKLQEMQRDLFMDKNISMNIESGGYKNGLSATFFVKESKDNPFSGFLCVKSFIFRAYLPGMKNNFKALRGIQHFVKNWQERLA